MSAAMHTGHDHHQDSPFHRLDPRVLLLAAVGAAFCFSAIQDLALSCACLAFALVLIAVRRPPLLPLLKHLAVVNFFVFFLWLTVPPTMPGTPVFSLGPFGWSREGLQLVLLVTVKCNAILLCFLALVAGMSLQRIGCALERLRVPQKLVFLFLFTCRYIHVIGEEWQRLQTTAKLRGFVPRNSMHTYRTIGNMLGFTLVNGIDRSRRIYEAMLLRGFNGTFHTVSELRRTPRDTAFALIFFLILGCLVLLDAYRQ